MERSGSISTAQQSQESVSSVMRQILEKSPYLCVWQYIYYVSNPLSIGRYDCRSEGSEANHVNVLRTNHGK